MLQTSITPIPEGDKIGLAPLTTTEHCDEQDFVRDSAAFTNLDREIEAFVSPSRACGYVGASTVDLELDPEVADTARHKGILLELSLV